MKKAGPSSAFFVPGIRSSSRRKSLRAPRRLPAGQGQQNQSCPTGNPHMAAMRKLPVVLFRRTISVLPKSPNQ
jgi:hypothetical protein